MMELRSLMLLLILSRLVEVDAAILDHDHADYVGCYEDAGERVMPYKQDRWFDNTPDVCVEQCRNLSFPYAGLQYWRECFCGFVYDTYAAKPENECRLKCPGAGADESHLRCGGYLRLSTYKTGRQDTGLVSLINPTYGSLAGGTKVTLFGAGFSDDKFNFGAGREHLGNTVSWVDVWGREYPCDIHVDGCTKIKLECYTRAMPVSEYYPRVTVDGREIALENICGGGNGFLCKFETDDEYTPLISEITPVAGPPESMLFIKGRIITELFDTTREKTSNGQTARVVRVWAGGKPCKLTDDLGVPYGIAVTTYWHERVWGNLTCKLTGTYVGNMNITLLISNQYGRSMMEDNAYLINRELKPFMFQTFAVINSLSTNIVGEQGGRLTISGNYFDPANTKVKVGDVDADVLDVTDTEINVIVPAKPEDASAASIGNRGWKLEFIYEKLQDPADYLNKPSTQVTYVVDQAYWIRKNNTVLPDNEFYGLRLSGFFVPPETGQYSVLAMGDDKFKVYMSTTGDPGDDMDLVLASSNNIKAYKFSDRRTLEGNKPYYMVSVIRPYRSSNHKLGLFKYATNLTADHSANVQNEKINIKQDTGPSYTDEEQVMTVPKDVDLVQLTKEIQTVLLQVTNRNLLDGIKFRLGLHNIYTPILQGNANAETVRIALQKLPHVYEETLLVTMESLANGNKYTITFDSELGDFPPLVGREEASGAIVTFVVEEIQKGHATGKFIIPSYNNVPSPTKLRVGHISADEMKSSLQELFFTVCSLTITAPPGLGFSHSYEEGETINGEGKNAYRVDTKQDDIPAFCGRYTLKNPKNIFNMKPDTAKSNGFVINTFKMLCFAHYGQPIQNRILVRYYYVDAKDVKWMEQYCDNEFTYTDGWNYNCVDILELIKTNHDPSVADNDLRLRTLKIFRTDLDKDLYVDMVSLTTNDNVPDDKQGLVEHERTVYAKSSNVRVVTGSDSSDATSYNIKMTRNDCAATYDGIIGIAFVPDSGNGYELGAGKMVNVTRTHAISDAISGNYGLAYRGKQLTGIDTRITGHKLKLLLEPFFNEGKLNVTRTGNCFGFTYEVEWLSNGGDKPNVTILDDGALGGETASIVIEIVSKSGILFTPLTADLMFLAHDTPQVTVKVNNIPSQCLGNCSIEWSADLTPTIASMNAASGSSNSVLTITGTAFGGNQNDVKVEMGSVECVISTMTETQISCTVGQGPAGAYPVIVLVSGNLAKGQLEFTYTFEATSMTPSSGSEGGGTTVNITGNGFTQIPEQNLQVTFGSETATILEVDYNNIVCLTPLGKGQVNIAVMQGGTSAQTSLQYTFESSLTPKVTAINGNLQMKEGEIITVTGSGLIGVLDNKMPNVTVGGTIATVTAFTDTSITITTPYLSPEVHELLISVPGKGYAVKQGSIPTVTIKFEVNTVTAASGSLNGGSTVTINGNGWGGNWDINDFTVNFGSTPCHVISDNNLTTANQLVCKMDHVTVHKITNLGVNPDEFTPRFLETNVGDMVEFTWTNKFIDITIQQTSGASDQSPLSGGFQYMEPPSKNGRLRIQMSRAGMVHYWSGFMVKDYSMHGTINVVDVQPQDECKDMVVKYLDYEATQNSGTSTASPTTTACTANPQSTCTSAMPSQSKFTFCFRPCETAVVQSMTATDGDASQTITLSGSGFSATPCQNTVTFGGYECTVQTASATQITCKINPDGFPVAKYQALKVTIGNLGYAKLIRQMGFTARPLIHSISPNAGSVHGGTIITLQGSGLCDRCFTGQRRKRQTESASTTSANAVVSTGNLPCPIVTHTFEEITCKSQAGHADYEDEINIFINVAGESMNAQCSACSYGFRTDATPSITQLASTITTSNQQITISGTILNDARKVMIGSTECTIVSNTVTSVTCNAGNPLAGSQPLYVVTIKGASNNVDVTIAGSISSVAPTSGSVEGGTELTITGFGFHTIEMMNVSNYACKVTEVSGLVMKCLTTPHDAGSIDIAVQGNSIIFAPASALTFEYDTALTPAITSITPLQGTSGNALTIIGSGFESQSKVKVMVGTASCTTSTASDSRITCTLGDHAAGSYPVEVVIYNKGKASGQFQFEYQLEAASVNPTEGSQGGGQIVTITGEGFKADANAFVCGIPCEVRGTPIATAIECVTPANAAADSDLVCDVTVEQSNVTVTLTNAYTYKTNLTPRITGLDPARGGTGGGNNIVITGSGFGSNVAIVEVSIAGVACVLVGNQVADTSLTCRTGPRKPSTQAPVQVTITGEGRAVIIDDVPDFLYIDVWSADASWGGSPPPKEGDIVVVPAGETLLIDKDTPVLKLLLINGGTVLFDETVNSIELQADIIFISGNGKMQVGTVDAPYTQRVIFTLHGHPRDKELPLYGTKGIFIREGVFEAHGKPKTPSHTLLSKTASSGGQQIEVQDAVNWERGDEIIIATTGWTDSMGQSEKRTITDVDNTKRVITLDKALVYEHLGVTIPVSKKNLDVRAEVGVLSRNILFRGSSNVQWHDKIEPCPDGFDPGEFATQTCFQGRFGEDVGSDEFGAHILVHALKPNENEACLRVSNMELTYAGQAFRLGRYAIHYHMNGHTTCSYVRNCAIHNSFNRAVNMHSTHGLMIENNVAYDIMGGAFFLEDGVETNNTLAGNLAIFVQSSTSLQNDDITPASFWITNANNIVRNNRAVGGTHFGFWFRMHHHPSGPSATSQICPTHVPLGVFEGNSAHSFGWFGIWVFPRWTPLGNCLDKEPIKAVLNTFTAWSCTKGIEFVLAGSLHVHNALLVNNKEAGLEWKELVSPREFEDDFTGVIGEGTVIAAYANGLHNTGSYRVGIVLPFRGGIIIKDVTFVNYNEEHTVCYSYAKMPGSIGSNVGGYVVWHDGPVYQDSPNRVLFEWEHQALIKDVSGTLTGWAGGSALPKSNLLPTSCIEDAMLSVSIKGAKCPANIGFTRFSWNEEVPDMQFQVINITNQYGTSNVKWEERRITHRNGWQVILPTNLEYTMTFPSATSFVRFNGRLYYLQENEYVILKYYTPRLAYGLSCNGTTRIARDDDTNQPLSSNSDAGSFYLEENLLSCMFSGRVSEEDEYSPQRTVNPKVLIREMDAPTTTVQPDTPAPIETARADGALLWKNSKWEVKDNSLIISETGTLSQLPPDSNVLIEKDTWVVFDSTAAPSISTLTVEGVLEFDGAALAPPQRRKRATASSCNRIVMDFLYIQGGRVIAGFDDAPFKGCLEIVLRGEKRSKELYVQNAPDIGTKAIVVFGGLDLHGEERSVKTLLAVDISKGDTSLTVVDNVDWKIGDQIVVAASGYMGGNSEVVTITSGTDRTFTVAEPFKHPHSGKIATINNVEFSMRTEVALLTRNIRIIGQEYGNQETESFGGRVLVSSFSPDARDGVGYARLSHVEFYRMGQYGATSEDDPRVALVFLNTVVDDSHPSRVTACVFHHGYNMGIGVYGTDKLVLQSNVVQGTGGPAFQITSSDVTLRDNLVISMLFEGTLGANDRAMFQWSGAYEIYKANNVTLEDNVCAGSERTCFRIKGQPCDTPPEQRYKGNVAHSGLMCVMVMADDTVGPCTGFYGFRVWNCVDFAFYINSYHRSELSDIQSVGSTIGLQIFIIGPSAGKHKIDPNKNLRITNATFAGTVFPEFCTLYTIDKSDRNWVHSFGGRGYHIGNRGKSGIVTPMFTGATNAFPAMPAVGHMAPQSIAGVTYVSDVFFSHYSRGCGGDIDAAIAGQVFGDDGLHPIIVSEIGLNEVVNKVYIPEPNVNMINPTDCVDMDCDGLKKVLITDTDGSFLGQPGSVTSVSEYAWDEDADAPRGTGDYRIPKMALTDESGGRIDVDSLVDGRGIVRDSSCVRNQVWNAYVCDNSIDYRMMHVESMDADTNTRRVSPVALFGTNLNDETYVDLINGPQDHGWCSGYTCQQRLSLFPMLVCLGCKFEIYYSGTTPQNSRHHLLNSAETDRVLVGIWFAQSWRLDIFVGGKYYKPKNSVDDGHGGTKLAEGDHFPDPAQEDKGTNWFDPVTSIQWFVLGGGTAVDIKTSPMVVVSFSMPPMTDDEFFGSNIVNNFAAFFGVPAANIKVVRGVAAQRRKKRDVDSQTVDVIISNPPADEVEDEAPTSTDTNTEGTGNSAATSQMSNTDFLALTAKVMDTMQTGGSKVMSEAMGVEVLSVTVVEPPLPPDSPEWQEQTESQYADVKPVVAASIQVPSSMTVTRQPIGDTAGLLLTLQPELKVYDEESKSVPFLGSSMMPWLLDASLFDKNNKPVDDLLSGNTTAKYKNGAFTFKDLVVTKAGNYYLKFHVSRPEDVTFDGQSESFVIKEPPTTTIKGSGNSAVTTPHKPHPEWACKVTQEETDLYVGKLMEVTELAEWDPNRKEDCYKTPPQFDLYGRYYLIFECNTGSGTETFPVLYEHLPPDYKPPEKLNEEKKVTITFDEDYDEIIGNKERHFENLLYNRFFHDKKIAIEQNTVLTDWDISKGSIIAAFTVGGETLEAVDNTVEDIWLDVTNTDELEFGGKKMGAASAMLVDDNVYTGKKKEKDVPPHDDHGGGGLGAATYAAIGIVCTIIIIAVAVISVLVYRAKNKAEDPEPPPPPMPAFRSVTKMDSKHKTTTVKPLENAPPEDEAGEDAEPREQLLEKESQEQWPEGPPSRSPRPDESAALTAAPRQHKEEAGEDAEPREQLLEKESQEQWPGGPPSRSPRPDESAALTAAPRQHSEDPSFSKT